MTTAVVHKLSYEELLQFRDEGYLLYEGLIHGEKLANYVSIFDELVERGKTLPLDTPDFSYEKDLETFEPIPGFLHKIQGVCVVDNRVLDLAKEPEILNRVECLLGPNIDVFGTKFFPKLPGGGTTVYWHQDNYFFGSTSGRIVSCGIYLQDSDRENGCLRLLPRSHLTQEIAEHKSKPQSLRTWVDLDDSEAIDVECPAGTVALFSANLLHGSHDNFSDRSRYSTAWHYIPADIQLERFPRGGYEDRHIVRGE